MSYLDGENPPFMILDADYHRRSLFGYDQGVMSGIITSVSHSGLPYISFPNAPSPNATKKVSSRSLTVA